MDLKRAPIRLIKLTEQQLLPSIEQNNNMMSMTTEFLPIHFNSSELKRDISPSFLQQTYSPFGQDQHEAEYQ